MAKSLAQVINLASVKGNRLRQNNVSEELATTTGSIILLQTYANLVAQQGLVRADQFPNEERQAITTLARHQESAKNNATYTLNSLCPALTRLISDVLAFSGMFDAFSEAITSLAPKFASSEQSRIQALALLEQLYVEAARRETTARELAAQINSLMVKLETDEGALRIDLEQMQEKLTSESGRLAEIQKEIESISSSIKNNIAGIAAGSVGILAGSIMIGIGALASLPSAGTATSLVVAGIGITVTGTGGLVAASVFLAENNKRLAELYEEQARINQLVTAHTALVGQVGGFTESVSRTAMASMSLQTEWTAVCTGIDAAKKELQRGMDASDAAHLAAAMQVVRIEWQGVANQARQMMGRLTEMTPQTVASVLDMQPTGTKN